MTSLEDMVKKRVERELSTIANDIKNNSRALDAELSAKGQLRSGIRIGRTGQIYQDAQERLIELAYENTTSVFENACATYSTEDIQRGQSIIKELSLLNDYIDLFKKWIGESSLKIKYDIQLARMQGQRGVYIQKRQDDFELFIHRKIKEQEMAQRSDQTINVHGGTNIQIGNNNSIKITENDAALIVDALKKLSEKEKPKSLLSKGLQLLGKATNIEVLKDFISIINKDE